MPLHQTREFKLSTIHPQSRRRRLVNGAGIQRLRTLCFIKEVRIMGKATSSFISYSFSRRGLLVLIPVVFICILLSARYGSVRSESFQNIVSSATSAFRSSCSSPQYDGHLTSPSSLSDNSDRNFTDLIFGDRKVYYGSLPCFGVLTVGPWRAQIPIEVTAGEEFAMKFICTNPDPKMCPTYYMVIFDGPSKVSVPPENFSPLNWTANTDPFQYAFLNVNFSIADPGRYKVFAYPELYYCNQWLMLQYPWHKATVEGTPFDIIVHPSKQFQEEGYGECTSDQQIYNGRYLSIDSSPEFQQMYTHAHRSYIYAPHNCKIPARSVKTALESLPEAKHVLYIGDSVTRNPFCSVVWKDIHGTVANSSCDPTTKEGEDDLQRYHYSHKFTHVEVDQGRSVLFTFLWSPSWEFFANHNAGVVLAMETLPTHIIINFGLWVPNIDADQLQEHFWNALVWIKHNVPTAKHIILKTPASVVQSVDCRGKDFKPDTEPPSDSLDYRIGASRKRQAIFDTARKWNNQTTDGDTGFKVSCVDAFWLTDSRPESTSDGRHYSSEGDGWRSQRPLIGEADSCIQDLIFDEFITGRVTV